MGNILFVVVSFYCSQSNLYLVNGSSTMPNEDIKKISEILKTNPPPLTLPTGETCNLHKFQVYSAKTLTPVK
jgi:hypothetical protein